MLAARQVFNDCVRALEMMESEKDEQVLRILWVANLALCRSIGHVLDKVDRIENPDISDYIDAKWKHVKLHPEDNSIFHEFIEEERNLLLKEYTMSPDTAPQVVISSDGSDCWVLDELLFCPMQQGTYAGDDCRDLLREAISWWDCYLLDLEARLQQC